MKTIPFEYHLASHLRSVHRLAVGLLGNEQEGHEIAQEALAKAWRARGQYDPSRPFSPWLFQIVRNRCKDALQQRHHRKEVSTDPERLLSSEPSVMERMSQADAEAQLRKAITRLSDAHREIIAMRHFQELSYAEIAETLSIPQSTVMSRLYRARQALTRLMEDSQ